MNWLHILTALAATAPATATVEPGRPIEPQDAEVLALEKERFERVTVPVTIGGQGPFRFMVDTGAQATVLSTVLADKLGLHERQQATLIGMASRVAVETTAIPDFTLGSRRFHIRTAALVEAENIGGADGILGLDSLQHQRVLIDFANQRIMVADAEDLGGNRGYEIVVRARRNLGQLVITNASLNGVDAAVLIDTGAQASVGNMALLERLRRARALGENTMTDINGQDLTGQVRVCEELTIGNLKLANMPILFVDAPPFEALGLAEQPALILGMNELRLFKRVAIDFNKRRVLFDLPRGSRRPNAITRAAFS